MNESLYSCKWNPTHRVTIKASVFVNNWRHAAQIFTREWKDKYRESCNNKCEPELSFEYLHFYLIYVIFFWLQLKTRPQRFRLQHGKEKSNPRYKPEQNKMRCSLSHDRLTNTWSTSMFLYKVEKICSTCAHSRTWRGLFSVRFSEDISISARVLLAVSYM